MVKAILNILICFSYLWSYIPFYLYDDMVMAILNGVNQTVEEMKKDWKLGKTIFSDSFMNIELQKTAVINSSRQPLLLLIKITNR